MSIERSYESFKLDSEPELIDALMKAIVQILGAAIERKGSASLAVSGGSSPKPLFRALSKASLNWSKVVITLVDDRWVSPDHKDSNEKLVRENLLVGAAAEAQWVPLYNGNDTPYSGLDECIETLQGQPVLANPLDVVLLGMGEDGHTASLFPCSNEVEQAVSLEYADTCIAVTPGSAPHARISLSLKKIVSAQHLFLLLRGKGKWEVFENAESNLSRDAWKEMPIRAVMAEAGAKFSVYWAE